MLIGIKRFSVVIFCVLVALIFILSIGLYFKKDKVRFLQSFNQVEECRYAFAYRNREIQDFLKEITAIDEKSSFVAVKGVGQFGLNYLLWVKGFENSQFIEYSTLNGLKIRKLTTEKIEKFFSSFNKQIIQGSYTYSEGSILGGDCEVIKINVVETQLDGVYSISPFANSDNLVELLVALIEKETNGMSIEDEEVILSKNNSELVTSFIQPDDQSYESYLMRLKKDNFAELK